MFFDPAPPIDPIELLTPNDLMGLVASKKWVVIAAFAIGLVVRLLKSDTKIPINIPPAYRVWLALALGAFSGGLDKVISDAGGAPVTWTSALTGGLIAAVLAIVSHNAVIESVRKGKEIAIPGLIIPGASPGPGKPVTLTPPALPTSAADPTIPPAPPLPRDTEPDSSRPGGLSVVFVMVVGLAVVLPGQTSCKAFESPAVQSAVLDVATIACVIANAEFDDIRVAQTCNIADKLLPDVMRILAEQRQSAARQAAGLARMRLAECEASGRPDAGAAAGKDGGK